MTWITFPHEKAHEALDQFLSGDKDGEGSDGRRISRNISAPDGDDLAAVILDPQTHRDLVEAHTALEEFLTPREDKGHPEGYQPFRHSPVASEERLLPVESLQEPLARIFHRKPFAELERAEQDKVTFAAMACLLQIRLDPDDTGAVPVLLMGHSREERDTPQSRMLWQLAYKTSVHGLYLRVTANGFLGEEWGIVTGSGFKVTSGYYERESAEATVAAIGRVLPQIDWMTVKNVTAFTPAAIAALKQVFLRYRYFGVDDKHPEPEPVTDASTSALAESEAHRG